MADSNSLKQFSVGTLTLLCCIFATYMTAKQVMRFLENGDSTAIHFRRFNLSPKDKYPTFSICLTDAEFYWNKAEEIFKATKLSPTMLEAMLKGKDAFIYDYNYTSMLYNKIPVDMQDYPNMNAGRFSLKLPEILAGIEYHTEHAQTSLHYGTGRIGKPLDKIPLTIGYNTTDTACYTRESDDSLETPRTYDWLEFNNSLFTNDYYMSNIYNFNSARKMEIDMQIFVHHPHQLMRSFHRPVFRSKVRFTTFYDQDTYDFRNRVLKIRMAKVRVLRKRSGSNVHCDDELADDDAKFQEELIKLINCIPPYWRRPDLPQKVCQTKTELHNAHTYIQGYKAILANYTSPCVQMEVSSKFSREEKNEWNNPRIVFLYEDKDYEEMQNSKSFDLESFVSSVGGFIGIFLGYSILQLPELLGSLKSIMTKIKDNTMNGKLHADGM